ncbi:MAG TPA: COX15/CtaA family protein [Candidatus Acidoferrales bacterium]|nr:COX15/CtaA family protein [Candidatus Acidoferrales bacterium]
MAVRPRAFQFISLATTVSIYVLIVLGGIVTSTGSQLACPDWPLCNGQLIPTFTTPVLIEYTHRVWTLVVTVLVVATAILAWKIYRWPNTITKLATLTLVLLWGQVVLGMVTVDSGGLPAVVTSHLALATLVFASALMTCAVSIMRTARGV